MYTEQPSKLIGEDIFLTFNFLSHLEIGQTLSSPIITVSLFSGIDPTASTILSGNATISGATVTQKIIDGRAGVIYLINCQVNVSNGAVLTEQITLAILSDDGSFVPSSIPTLTGDLPDGVVGAAYSQNLAIAGGYMPYATATPTGSAPEWMGFTVVDDTLICAGTSSSDALASYSFNARIQDAALTFASSAQVVNLTRTTVAGSLGDLTVGTTPSFSYTASLGTAPYTFAIVGGELPTGLTLNSNGSISGTTTTAGSFSWTVRGTDANNITDDHPDSANVRILSWLIQSFNDDVIYYGADSTTWNTTFNVGAFSNRYVTVTQSGRILSYEAGQAKKSDDNGVSWQNINLPTGIPAIYVSPSGRLLAPRAADSTVQYSDDDGNSWTGVSIGIAASLISGHHDVVIVANGANRVISTNNGTSFGSSLANGFTCSSIGCHSESGLFVFGAAFFTEAHRWSVDNGTTLNSATGSNTTSQTIQMLPTTGTAWIAILRRNSESTTESIMYSPTGKTGWTGVTTPSIYFESSESQRAAYRGNIIVANGKNTAGKLNIIRSLDGGLTWSSVSHSYGASAEAGIGIAYLELDAPL